MAEKIYYVDTEGLCEGNRELMDMGCDECPKKKCADGVHRNLARLPDKEHLGNFLKRASKEQWPVRVFWAMRKDGLPRRIAIEDLKFDDDKPKVRRERSQECSDVSNENWPASLLPVH